MKPLLLWLLAGLWLAAPAVAADKPLVGLSVNVPTGGGEKELVAALLSARDAHAGLMCVSYKWSDLEPTPSRYALEPIRDALRGAPLLGFRVAITLQTLDTNNRALPADLSTLPFDSPVLRGRFDALLTRIAPVLTDTVTDISLGNEADIYLRAHPAETEGYAGFVEAGRRRLRALRPGLPVGVTTTFDGLRESPEIGRRLNREMDVIPMTYYPLTAYFTVRPAREVGTDFNAMTAAAGGKPLLLSEVGCPAAPLLGSSDDTQAAFVDAAFDALVKRRAQIGFVNFFLMYDFSDAQVAGFVKYYRVPDPRFRAYLSTLGLKRSDGTPRPAWARFTARAGDWAGRP